MSYLYDRKQKKARQAWTIVVILVVVIVILLSIGSVRKGLQSVFVRLGIPFMQGASYIEGDAFVSRKALLRERDALKQEVETLKARDAEFTLLQQENESLKQQGENPTFIRAEILAKPSTSVYDSLVVNKGSRDGVFVGTKVYASPTSILGTVSEVFETSSKIKLYSTPGEKTSVVVLGSNVTAEAVGRGGQNFELTFPRDVEIPVGSITVLPGMSSAIVGIVEQVLFDPRDPFQKVLLRSTTNVEHLLWVEIEQ